MRFQNKHNESIGGYNGPELGILHPKGYEKGFGVMEITYIFIVKVVT